MNNFEPCERETHVSFDDESDTAQCYTLNRKVKNRLFRLCKKNSDIITESNSDADAATFYFPKNWIHIRPPKRISESQREAARQNIEKARQKAGQKANGNASILD